MTDMPPFPRLLHMAAQEREPQRLLFVFTGVELPPDASAEQRARFEAGRGGALTPLACVDKGLDELGRFEDLVAESRRASPPWGIVFIAALGGRNGQAPDAATVTAALNRMVESIRTGRVAGYLALDPDGDPVMVG